jgi:hypothetical protein
MKASTFSFYVAAYFAIWDKAQHEPLMIAVCLPLSKHRPWNLHAARGRPGEEFAPTATIPSGQDEEFAAQISHHHEMGGVRDKEHGAQPVTYGRSGTSTLLRYC